MGMVCSIGDTAADDGVEGPVGWSDDPRCKVPYSVRGSLTRSDEVSRLVWRSWSWEVDPASSSYSIRPFHFSALLNLRGFNKSLKLN